MPVVPATHIGRRITVKGQPPGKNVGTYLKNNESKKGVGNWLKW
jgi:hypothetical protein